MCFQLYTALRLQRVHGKLSYGAFFIPLTCDLLSFNEILHVAIDVHTPSCLIKIPGASRELSEAGMNWATWCFGVVMLILSSGHLGLMWRLWVLRNEFEVAARSPTLLNISASTALALMASVLLHWLLLTMDKRLPCAAIFWISPSRKAVAMLSLHGTRFGFRRARRTSAAPRRPFSHLGVRFEQRSPLTFRDRQHKCIGPEVPYRRHRPSND